MDDHPNDIPEDAEADSQRPDQEEPNGPLEGLVRASASELKEQVSGDPGHDSEAANPAGRREVGAQEEGVEASQLLGLMFATVLSIAGIVFVLYFLFFVTQREKARYVAANVPADRYVEQRELRAAAMDSYAHYAISPTAEGRYRIPINAAMEIVERGAAGGVTAPDSRVGFNLVWLTLHPSPATNSASSGEAPVELGIVASDSTATFVPDEPAPAEEPAHSIEETQ